MERDPVIAERILSDMSDGVMTINCEGRIITFNRSAAGILGITREEVLDAAMTAYSRESVGSMIAESSPLSIAAARKVRCNRFRAGKP